MEEFNTNMISNQEPLFSREDVEKMKKREKRGIFLIGLIAGACVIGYVLLNDITSLPIVYSKTLRYLYYNNEIFTYCVSIFMSIFCLMVPFLSGGILLKKVTRAKYRFFNKPDDMTLAVYAVPMGVFACVIGDHLTNIFIALMKQAGFTLTSPDYDTPTSVPGRIIYVIAIAVVPPIVEEIALRGCIMQPLRKYGDRFAIVMTAFLFAVLHGNLIQAPFAFIAGIAFGYITCMTGSLIPSMIVHSINNLYSVSLEFISADAGNAKIINIYYFASEILLITLGVIAAVFFIFRLNHRTTRNPQSILTNGGKVSAFIVNPTMIIALMIMIYITSNYVSYSPVT